MTQTLRIQPTPINHRLTTTQQTLIDHLRELRARLFWVVLALVIASGLGYSIQAQIMAALMHPLGGQQLVYLTPIGGFNFIFKVSLYFGIGLILPIIIYHLYRFLEPLMDRRHKQSVVFYSIASLVLALCGASFAYFASLPAALHFLTGFNIQNVSAMLTVDSYLTFVITYILGFAALFQIPLILMIINTIKPIPPKKLMSFQRYVILAAFILAAIISPTPDITNQTILAVPIILMYQVGIALVWIQSRASRQSDDKKTATLAPASVTTQPIVQRPIAQRAAPTIASSPQSLNRRPRPVMAMDVSSPRRSMPRSASRPLSTMRRPPSPHTRLRQPTLKPAQVSPISSPRPLLNRPTSIDGIMPIGQNLRTSPF